MANLMVHSPTGWVTDRSGCCRRLALCVFVVVNQMALDRDAADRRALVQRHTALTASAMAPGSPSVLPRPPAR